MKRLEMMFIVFIFIVAGCTAKQEVKMSSGNVQSGSNIKTVSVATFKCSDPLVAQDIKNKIVESLLADYSVVIGDEADVSVTGVITLMQNSVAEVKAEIMRGNNVLTAISVGQSGSGSDSKFGTHGSGN